MGGQRPQMGIGIYGSTELSGSDIQGDVITHTLPSLLKGVPYHVQVSASMGWASSTARACIPRQPWQSPAPRQRHPFKRRDTKRNLFVTRAAWVREGEIWK